MRGIVVRNYRVTRGRPFHAPRRVIRRPRKLQGVYCAKRLEDRFPFDKPIHDKIYQRSEALHFSLFAPMKNLPPDGRFLTEREEKTDPAAQRNKTPTYVYETVCPICKGSGMVESKSKGKRRIYTCLSCHGLGYVRRVTARFVPKVNANGLGPHLTLRPELKNGHHDTNE